MSNKNGKEPKFKLNNTKAILATLDTIKEQLADGRIRAISFVVMNDQGQQVKIFQTDGTYPQDCILFTQLTRMANSMANNMERMEQQQIAAQNLAAQREREIAAAIPPNPPNMVPDILKPGNDQ